MLQSKLSTKGQVIIPKPLRNAHNWKPGQNLVFIDTRDGILVRSAQKPFPETSLDEVAGCLQYHGKAKSIAEMNDAIAKGAAGYLE